MSEEKAAGDLWSPIKDGNAGFVFLLLALAALAFAIYFFRYRPVPVSELLPSPGRFQQIAAIGAVTLLAIAAAAALWQVISPAWQEDGSTLQSTLASVKELNWAAVVLAGGLIVSIAAFYLLRSQDQSIADFWQAHTPSLDGLRGYAIAIAAALVTCIVVGSIIGFFWAASSSEFTSIAPFTISGSDDKQRGMALATGFQAKLAELLRDARVLDDVLQEDSETGRDPDTQAPNQDQSASISLNVYPKLDLDLKFQGVDVGGILNGVVNWMAMRRALQITVAESEGNAIVSGALRPDGVSHVYASVKGDDEIVAAVAYSKLRDRLIAQQPEFEALDWKDIQSLHLSIMAITQLRERSQATMADYKAYHDAVANLIVKAPRLEALLALGAEVAMKAGNVDRALGYLDRTKEFLDKMREELDQSRPSTGAQTAADDDAQSEFDALKRKFLSKYNSLVVQRERVISSCALPLVERLNGGEAAEPIFATALARHRELLRIDSVEPKQEIIVAIVGGVPQREPIGYKFSSSGDWLPGKYGLANFADTIGLIVTTLAPAAKLVFVPLGPKSRARGLSVTANEAEIAQAVDAAVKAKADIVVIPFNAVGGAWKTRIATVRQFASKTTILLPAPSQGVQARYVPDGIAAIPAGFVASVDVDGKFKASVLSFDETLSTYPGAIWAPGMRVPRLTADGMWQTTYGGIYAAATAAAAIANIAAASGIRQPGKLIDLVRGTVQHLDSSPGIGIIDQTAALTPSDPAPGAKPPASTCVK